MEFGEENVALNSTPRKYTKILVASAWRPSRVTTARLQKTTPKGNFRAMSINSYCHVQPFANADMPSNPKPDLKFSQAVPDSLSRNCGLLKWALKFSLSRKHCVIWELTCQPSWLQKEHSCLFYWEMSRSSKAPAQPLHVQETKLSSSHKNLPQFCRGAGFRLLWPRQSMVGWCCTTLLKENGHKS